MKRIIKFLENAQIIVTEKTGEETDDETIKIVEKSEIPIFYKA